MSFSDVRILPEPHGALKSAPRGYNLQPSETLSTRWIRQDVVRVQGPPLGQLDVCTGAPDLWLALSEKLKLKQKLKGSFRKSIALFYLTPNTAFAFLLELKPSLMQLIW